MAKFEDLKPQLNFIYETAPVLAISLKQELIDKANSEEKESKRKKEVLKLEKLFNSKLSKDILKKGYEIIEDYKLLDEDDEDPVLNRTQNVVIAKGSFIYLTDLKESEQASFSAGVRLMDDMGNISMLPDIIEFQNLVDKETSIETAIEQYDAVVDVLREIEEKGFIEEEDEEVEQFDEYNHEDSETRSENRNEETDSKESSESSEEVYEKIDHEVEPEKEIEPVNTITEKSFDKAEEHVFLRSVPTETFEEELYKKIEKEFSISTLPYMDFYKNTIKDITGLEELDPLIKLAENSINVRIEIANNEIKEIAKKSIEELKTLGKDLLNDELHLIKSQTSLELEDSPFFKAIKEVEKEYKEQLINVDAHVNEKTTLLRKKYEDEKKTYGELAKKRAMEEFEIKHLPVLQKDEADYRQSVLDSLKQQKSEGEDSLRKQAESEKNKAEEKLIEKIFDLISNDVESKKNVVNLETEKILRKVTKKNEEESKEIKEKAYVFAIKSKENQEIIDKKVSDRSLQAQKLASDLEKVNVEYDELLQKNVEYSNQISELENIRKTLENQLSNTVKNFNQLLDTKTGNEINYQKEVSENKTSEKKETFSNRKMGTILGSVGLGCACLVLSTALIVSSLKQNVETVGTTTPKVVKTVETATSETKEESSEYHGFKVGDKINIDPDNSGKSVKATVKSIEGNNLLVETDDEQQYYVSINNK